MLSRERENVVATDVEKFNGSNANIGLF